ncbi:MAG: efflux RND transporter periplasmic adaptor subunit [Aquisalinus sp.]|nr:efflux RND transporter periplasmic adaptor subunit [Aquisalinus sp.]
MNWKFPLILVFAAFSLAGCADTSTEDNAPPKVRPAKIVTVTESVQSRELSFPAVVRAAQSAELTFQTQGEIKELNILQGEPVVQGDVLATLDQRNAQNAVEQARAEYGNAEAEYQRAVRLVERDAISRSVLDQRRTQRDIAKVNLANAEKTLADTVMVAPFDGAASRVFVEQFQNIQAKEPILILQSDLVEAVVNVPGTIIAQVPRLAPSNAVVKLDAAPDLEIPAIFKEAAGLADQSTQTYEVTFAFDPPEDLLILPGMTATLFTSLAIGNVESFDLGGVAVPLGSILAEGDNLFVWVVDPSDQSLIKTAVTIGDGAGDQIVVTSGLTSGQQIVAAGVSFLNEGMRVTPWTPE